MKQALAELLTSQPEKARALGRHFLGLPKKMLLRSEVIDEFARFCECAEGEGLRECSLAETVPTVQEAVINGRMLFFAVRPAIGTWEYLELNPESLTTRSVPVERFLHVKEQVVLPPEQVGQPVLEVDLRPFERDYPKLERPRSIGRGVQFLNRHLAGRLFIRNGRGAELLFDFLKVHQYRDRQLMVNERIKTTSELKDALREAVRLLEGHRPDTPIADLQTRLSRAGFEPGWGNSARRIAETMNLLLDVIEAPDAAMLEAFLSRIPMMFNLVILSPHGYFGQSNVLGKPDTGGQVVYILDQVRALEKELRESIREQGLDIEPRIVVLTRLIPEADGTGCDVPVERVHGTESAEIVRIPFRYENGDVVPHWISRFKIWPFLERFAAEAEEEVVQRLGVRPDLVIGNYSDGNLVASILAHRLGVTQCTIAHALEKTKYLYSDLYWKDHEEEHRFACQFTADLIAMNTADFIITSTYQEIAGTEQTIGQYESYTAFSLPGLYRVLSGVDPYDPKFNIVSPGADPAVFHSYAAASNTPPEVVKEVEDLVHGGSRDDALGEFSDKRKPLLFAMSRLDSIKNVAGLVDWYGSDPRLRELANLLIVGGHFRMEDSSDAEESEQIRLIHELIERHRLEGQIRWVVMQTDKVKVGEFYRHVARRKGAFVQPAKFEAFGLTVIEAMTSGLPVFATRYGGPLEIIEDTLSGFHIDPNNGTDAAERMRQFFETCTKDSGHWQTVSEGAMKRVEEHYTWERYARRILSLSRIYGFWKHMTKLEHADTRMYVAMFYHLMFRRLAHDVPV